MDGAEDEDDRKNFRSEEISTWYITAASYRMTWTYFPNWKISIAGKSLYTVMTILILYFKLRAYQTFLSHR